MDCKVHGFRSAICICVERHVAIFNGRSTPGTAVTFSIVCFPLSFPQAFEGIVYPSYFKEIWGQTENDHLLPSLIHFWNAIALTAALVLTMVFEPKAGN